jgi:hypothetical protein
VRLRSLLQSVRLVDSNLDLLRLQKLEKLVGVCSKLLLLGDVGEQLGTHDLDVLRGQSRNSERRNTSRGVSEGDQATLSGQDLKISLKGRSSNSVKDSNNTGLILVSGDLLDLSNPVLLGVVDSVGSSVRLRKLKLLFRGCSSDDLSGANNSEELAKPESDTSSGGVN